jgi:creatinine amidohydrolase
MVDAQRYSDVERLGDAELRALLARRPVVLLPLGAVESHGDHLPAGTDNILARRLAEKLTDRIAGRVPLLILPTFTFGQVWSLEDAPGSFSLSNETVARALVEIGLSCLAKGVAAVAVVNAHYGNAVAIRDAQRRLKSEGLAMAHLCYTGADPITAQIRERPPAHPAFMHACEIETSYMLHLAPEAVRMEAAIENYPAFPDDFGELPYRWSEFSASPVLGDARLATAEKGRLILDVVLDRMTEIVMGLHARHAGGESDTAQR